MLTIRFSDNASAGAYSNQEAFAEAVKKAAYATGVARI